MTLPSNAWQHGDVPTAAEINLYGETLDAAHDILGDIQLNFATLARVSESQFTFVHLKRYLWFRSSGILSDPSGVGDDVSLSEDNGDTRYDLNGVSWLVYGALYKVTGVSWCAEAET